MSRNIYEIDLTALDQDEEGILYPENIVRYQQKMDWYCHIELDLHDLKIRSLNKSKIKSFWNMLKKNAISASKELGFYEKQSEYINQLFDQPIKSI